MITNKKELRKTLLTDFQRYPEFNKTHFSLRFFLDDRRKLLKVLRKLELFDYLFNSNKSYIYAPSYYFNLFRLNKLGHKIGVEIKKNTFGPGLYITHTGGIVVNGLASIGDNCTINAGVNIGNSQTANAVPQLGNNVWIGPGAKIFGKIVIADGIAIGANAVVNKSFQEENISIAGVPAKKISNNGSNKQI